MIIVDYMLLANYNTKIARSCERLGITVQQAEKDFDEFVDSTHDFVIELMGFEYSPSEVFKNTGGSDYYEEFILYLEYLEKPLEDFI